MKMTGNTILITGGTSGIGLELATQLRPGVSNVLKLMSRLAPAFMFRQLNKPVAKELAKVQREEVRA